jgi:HEAT repeat protein
MFAEPICSLLTKKDKWVRIYAVQALGDINATQQAGQVSILLEDKDEAIRLNALRTLARIGDDTSARKISEAMKRRKEVLSSGQSEKDYTLREGDKTVQEIRRRLQATESDRSNPSEK